MTARTASKLIDKELRKLGATRETIKDGHLYTLPDGSRVHAPSNIQWYQAWQSIRAARERAGAREFVPFFGDQVRERDAPKVDLERLRITAHAQQRRREMAEQDDLTTREITMALVCPTRIIRDDKHESWVYVGDRVAVAGQFDQGVFMIRTILWTTAELWEKNPRMEATA